ncbi:DUF92 domain-containing protein [Mucilaginibacter sp. UR6-1]|uniref:DUF92 domain-containing protein n=1 Tax=Mucilaginibacter sp. UR6-1 TaxID=1435643 RepID=UPI001E448D18|nr:DUF92 domain-containing protein [Mucilaginibacter sp. UR6-1]MCC8410054.1 DUF92 domain-containing protein [Mucilaginibacter sp. UR6-1]
MNNTTSYLLLAALLTAGVTFALIKHKLTPLAALTGVVVALLLFAAGGFTGVMLMTVFFIIGTAVTSHKKALKQQTGADNINAPRDSRQVLANSGMAAILAILILLLPGYKTLFTMMIAAAFATASGDTASSELGMVYGRKFYNIITLKKDARGLDGVISLEGTLLGIAASMVIAAVYAIYFGWGWSFAVLTLSGLTGNLTDSLLGAVLERKHRLGNNMVNFLATLAGALAAWLLA